MNVRFGKFGIRTDSRNFTLYEVVTITGENARGKKPKAENIGKEREVDIGHYYLLNHALKRLLSEELRSEDITSLQKILSTLEGFEKTLETFRASHGSLIEKAKSKKTGVDDDDAE